MLLEQDLIQFFGNLPSLPRMEMIKHFDKCELTKLAILSENWTEVVKFQFRKRENVMEILLKTMENSAKIEICFDQWFVKSAVLSIDFFVNSVETNRVLLSDPEFIEFYSKDAKTRESKILSTIDLFRSMFQLEIHTIHLNFDHGYSLKFFEFLELKKVVFLVLDSEKTRINGAELGKILEKMEIRAELELKMKSIRNFKGGEHLLNQSIILEDSRWITGKMLVEKFDWPFGYFNKCRFTERDYNLFLTKWKNDEKTNIDVMQFQSEHTLDLDKVIRGLDAKPWDPAVRSRKKDVTFSKPLRYVDLANGWDFVTMSGTLITVCLSENRKTLQIHSWEDGRFPLRKLRKCLKSIRKRCVKALGWQDLSRRRRMRYEMDIIEANDDIRLIEEEMKDN